MWFITVREKFTGKSNKENFTFLYNLITVQVEVFGDSYTGELRVKKINVGLFKKLP